MWQEIKLAITPCSWQLYKRVNQRLVYLPTRTPKIPEGVRWQYAQGNLKYLWMENLWPTPFYEVQTDTKFQQITPITNQSSIL